MTSLLSPILLLTIALLVLVVLLNRLPQLKRSFYIGILIWSRWIPVCAAVIYLAVLGLHLLPVGGYRSIVSISNHLSKLEIMTLFAIGIFFFSPLGNLISTVTLLYLSLRFSAISPSHNISIGIYLLLGSTTLVALLADKLPWLTPQGTNSFAQRIRQIILFVLAISFISTTILAISRIQLMAPWVENYLKISFSNVFLIAFMMVTVIGWLTVFTGWARHLAMLALALPSLIIMAFVTSLPTYVLVIPFTACLALSLATAERRLATRRQLTL